MADRMTPEEAEAAMKRDEIRAFSIDSATGKVDGVKTWDDHWTLFNQPKPKENT